MGDVLRMADYHRKVTKPEIPIPQFSLWDGLLVSLPIESEFALIHFLPRSREPGRK